MQDRTLSNSLIVIALALIVAFAALAGPSVEPPTPKPVAGRAQ